MARLTAAQRRSLPSSAFAGPNRSYPVNDANHARAALSMAARYASPKVKAQVRGKVDHKYPGMDEKSRKKLIRMVKG